MGEEDFFAQREREERARQPPTADPVGNLLLGIWLGVQELQSQSPLSIEFRERQYHPDRLLTPSEAPLSLEDPVVVFHYGETPIGIHVEQQGGAFTIRYTIRDRGERLKADRYLERQLHRPVTVVTREFPTITKRYLAIDDKVREHHLTGTNALESIQHMVVASFERFRTAYLTQGEPQRSQR